MLRTIDQYGAHVAYEDRNSMDQTTLRQRIEDFIHDCAHCIDDDRLEAWPSYFVEDCRYTIIDRESYARGLPVGIMTCDSRGMLEDRVRALREANIYEAHYYRHLISGIRIRGNDGDVYSVQTSYALIRTMQEGDITVFSSGKILDEIVVSGERLLFKERTVVCDSNRIDTLIVIPI
jgi:anthranilate 1,2-dioxygenase small subunit